MKLCYLIISGIFIFSSCASQKKKILNSVVGNKDFEFEYKPEKVNFYVKRDSISSGKIKMPTITFPGQYDKIVPTFTDNKKEVIIKQLNGYFTQNGEPVTIKYFIKEGYQEFSALPFSEREYTYFDIEIELYSKDELINKCSSSAYHEVLSMDASRNYIEKLYEKTIKLANYKCFDQF